MSYMRQFQVDFFLFLFKITGIGEKSFITHKNIVVGQLKSLFFVKKCIKNHFPRPLTTNLTSQIHLQMQLTHCVFTLIIETIKNNIFVFGKYVLFFNPNFLYKEKIHNLRRNVLFCGPKMSY